MDIELLLIPLIFILSFWLAKRNLKAAISTLLILSLLLHKELFSIYRWDILPVRLFMLALLVFTFWRTLALSVKKKENVKSIKSFIQEPFILLLGSLWAVRGASIIFTKNLQSSVFLFVFFTTVVGLGILLYRRYRNDPVAVLKFVRFYIFLVFLASLFGFVQLYIFYTQGFVIGSAWPVPGNIPRIGSVFWDVNHFAGLISALMPVLGVLILTDRGWKKKSINILMFGVLLVVLLLTNSRTAWLGAFFSFISFIVIMLYRKYRHKGVIFLVATIILLSIPLTKEYSDKKSPFRRQIKDYFHYRIDSFDSHILLLRGTFEIFEDKPILGGGYGGFFEHFSKTDVGAEFYGRDPAALNTRVPAHTIWGELLAETGIIGFSVYILLFLLIIGTLIYNALTSKVVKEVLITAAMGSSLIGLHIGGVFYSYNAEFFWLIIFFYYLYVLGISNGRATASDLVNFFTKPKKLPVVIISVLAIFLIFIKLGANHFIPWDEAIYAEISKNILLSKDYMALRWAHSELWFEKPPLYMWLAAISMKILGISEFSARLPSALFGFSTVVLVYYFGKQFYSRLSGFISAFVLLTTFQFLYYSRAAMLDVAVTFFITLSLYLYFLAIQKKQSAYWIMSGLASGFAVMTKGVVGLLPFLVIFLNELYLFKGGFQTISKDKLKLYGKMIIFSALVFLPWHLKMIRRFGVNFINSYFIYHVLSRAAAGIEDKGRPIFWYIVVLKVSMRIWFIALLAAFPITFMTALFGNLKGLKGKFEYLISPRKYTFLLIYSLAIFVFFSVAKSKLVWYIMPLYPPLAIIVGIFISRAIDTLSNKYSSLALKFLLVYATFIFGLFYLYTNKELVYTSDLSGKQAMLLKLKDQVFGTDPIVYADRVEHSLVEYYTDGPYEVTDFGPLTEVVKFAQDKQEIIFITKESRFRALREIRPEIELVERFDQWVLAVKPAL